MYSFKSRVRYSEVGEDKKLSLNGIINYFQDCSTFQSEMLNNGVERLEELHRVWVLSSWQIVIERYPKLCEEIEIGTWPYYFKNFAGYRNFTMRDQEGKLIAYANSLWSFLDTDTGLPTRVPEDIEILCQQNTKLAKLADPALSVLAPTGYQVGMVGAKCLMDHLDRGDTLAPLQLVAPKLVKRGSIK